MKYVWLVALAVVASCSKSNSEACCTSQADCTAVGLPVGSTCPSGQGCSDHACVTAQCTGDSDCSAPTPVCSGSLCVTCDATHGCAASEPVCSIDMTTCNTCGDSSDCASFPDAPVCDTTSGGCVQCVTAADCATATPVCDHGACRACTADADCPSGACALDGTCVDATAIIYVSPTGVDAGSCLMMSPCATLSYALTQVHSATRDIVLAAGSYSDNVTIVGGALPIGLHGGGATLSAVSPSSPAITTTSTPVLISDLMMTGDNTGDGSTIVTGTGMVTLRSVTVDSSDAILVGGPVLAQDLEATNTTNIAIIVAPAGDLTLDRAVIHGGSKGLSCSMSSATPSRVALQNVMVYGMANLALDLTYCKGTVAFTTATASGSIDNGAQVKCGTLAMSISSSIVWGTAAGGPVVGNCTFASTIAGPTPVTGTMTSDPLFANPAANDFHITAASPAKDAVTTGPIDDFEGDTRPQGAAYDIGADELKQP